MTVSEQISPLNRGERTAVVRYFEVGSDVSLILAVALADMANRGHSVPLDYCGDPFGDGGVDRGLWAAHLRHASDYLMAFYRCQESPFDVDDLEVGNAMGQVAFEWVGRNLGILWD